MAYLWLEAESFENLGGWVVDSQSMDQMGSAYVMAHGMGVPVADAETTHEIPESGKYIVWARTRDWTAVWKRGTPAGQFKVIINGTELPEVLGTNGTEWGWQRAGKVDLEAGNAKFALHDLTGFNGRCDALYLTTDTAEVPANDSKELAAMRRERAHIVCEDDPYEYDLIICGGGIAGVCTAVSALRNGAKVALLQDRPVLGGCNSSEIRVSLGGITHVGMYPNLGNVVREISPAFGGNGTYSVDVYEDDRKRNIFKLHPADSCHLGLNERVTSVETDPSDSRKIVAVVTTNTRTGAEKRYHGKLFSDCTGDAVIARMIGCEMMRGRDGRAVFNESLAPEEANNQVMGMSVQWYSKPAEEPTDFADVDWGVEFNEDNVYYVRGGDWECETGQYRNQAEESEYIRDYGLMVTFSGWSFLKNHSKRKDEWSKDTLAWVSHLGGKRESYRVVGGYVLNQNDIEDRVIYEDATAPITWNIDLHFPDPDNEDKFDEPFRSCAYHRSIYEPYPVPYRCLYARDVDNLFLGGRHISLSHVAFAAARVQRILGMLGEVVGMAAAICAKKNASPKDVYDKYLDDLKAMMTAGVPPVVYHPGGNGDYEMYHFKELGHMPIPRDGSTPKWMSDEKVMARVSRLNMPHRGGNRK